MQVWFLLRQNFRLDKHVFFLTNACLLRQKTCFVMTKVGLSWQTYSCRNNTFVATNIRRDKHNFVLSKLLSRQACSCCDRCLSWQNMTFVTTKGWLSQQNFCHNIMASILLTRQKMCFVATSILLSQQKMCFVVTIMKLVAAPTSDKWHLWKLGTEKSVEEIKESVNVDVSDVSGNKVRKKEGIHGSVSVDVSDISGNMVREKEKYRVLYFKARSSRGMLLQWTC